VSWGRGRVGAVSLALAVALLVAYALSDPQRYAREAQVKRHFDQATALLQAKDYDRAIAALHRVIELAPRMPEARVNMGYALLGKGRADDARRAFLAAIELKPEQANAYYGLAMADEMRQDWESALGGMRSYLHLSKADDPFRTKARAAIWEWEDKLGRHQAFPESGKNAAQITSNPLAR
jgi:Flp pilus assembly protein TadD